MSKIIIDPITRIEGHLSVELEVSGGKVADARIRGDMFRGFEKILVGRNPVDAVQITQRICGVCPISHGIASCRCLEDAFKNPVNKNGRLLRNLVLTANFLQSHILHFYHLAALDYVDITAVTKYTGMDPKLNHIKNWVLNEMETKKGRLDQVTTGAPFLPRYEGEGIYIQDDAFNLEAIAHYVKALDIRLKTHQLVAVFGGRVPHAIGLVPGGITQVPTKEKIKLYQDTLEEVEHFVNQIYLPDIVAVAQMIPDYFKIGQFQDFLAYGEFPAENGDPYFKSGVLEGGNLANPEINKITEQVKYTRYVSPSNLHPSGGQTEADPKKTQAYSWIKAPRYNGNPMEVGPLARTLINYHAGHAEVKQEVDGLLNKLNADASVLLSSNGRHAARAIESKLLCARAKKWISEININEKPRSEYSIPSEGSGTGLAEAPRGALGHWITIDKGKIGRYQCVVPTTWNASPRDDSDNKGPIEQALIGTPVKDENNPIEATRVIRSFDPCIACAVHAMRKK